MSDDTVRVTLRLPRELAELLDAWAAERFISRNSAILQLLAAALRKGRR